jgi:hypothetical protein
MTNLYIIIMICLGVCAPKITGAATEPARFLKALNGLRIYRLEPSPHGEIYLAQNDPKKTQTPVTNHDLPKAGEKTTPSETMTKDKNTQKNTRQITPFMPSEKIPADQGVDFPYDI